MLRVLWITLIVLCTNYKFTQARICSRYPANTFTPKSPVDENYALSISGNPETYILGQEYNVSLNAYNGRRYIRFLLALENDNGASNFLEDLGHFEVTDSIETRYSPNCINMVESTNTNPKTHTHVTWIAPSEPGSGCILIRATLLQHRDVWHMDDGGLTRRICEEITDDVESRPATPVEENLCCACDEARYELIFEGVWSRNLHPKNFPAQGWITRFGDIVGAAHTSDYRFWEYGTLATEAMKQYAQYNTAQLLEKEFSENFRDGKIRTIIKARGPAYPNLNGKSIASVRVDPQHHLVSFASKIEPSPDWIVGVSGLELCMQNCTWLEQKVISLYPWDIGTDAGPSYTSPDQPQIPPDVIRRIRSDSPNDPRSPFYDESGTPMKPMATLTVRRKRLYERLCAEEDSNNIDISRECFTHPWTSWTECTSICGEGRQLRHRIYKQPDVAKVFNCDVELKQERTCQGTLCGVGDGPRDFNEFGSFEKQEIDYNSRAECQISEWGSWSQCSRACGEGKETRRRQYINPAAESKCQSTHFFQLVEHRRCLGKSCAGPIDSKQFGNESEKDFEPIDNSETDDGDTGYGRYGGNTERESTQYNNRWRPREDRFRRVEETEDEDDGGGNTNSNKFYGQQFQPNEGIQTGAVEEDQKYGHSSLQIGNLVKSNNEYALSTQQETSSRWQKPINNHRNSEMWPQSFDMERKSFQSKHYPPNRNTSPQKFDQQQRSFRGQSYATNFERNSGVDMMPSYCFDQLKVVNCRYPKVISNYWFYNHCSDECMQYAADACDRNENKFNSLEQCESRCRKPEYAEQLLRRQRQNTNECQHSDGQRNSWRRTTNTEHIQRNMQYG